eukprot:scaffold26879_cov212-Skeletonema_marinoi.AAC.1
MGMHSLPSTFEITSKSTFARSGNLTPHIQPTIATKPHHRRNKQSKSLPTVILLSSKRCH